MVLRLGCVLDGSGVCGSPDLCRIYVVVMGCVSHFDMLGSLKFY